MKKLKRTAAFITAVAITFSLFPTAALASNEQDLEAGSLTEDYIYSEGLSPQYLTEAEELVGTDVLVGGYEASGYSEDYYITQTTPSVPTTNTFTVDDITYQMLLSDNYIPTNRVQVLRCNKGKTGEVVVPDTVENNGVTYEVISVGFASFLGCDDITEVTIPSSVTTINSYAFCGCSSLKKAWVPNSVTSMGEAVFAECSALNDVRLSASLTELPDYTFQDCDSIKSVGVYSGNTYTTSDVQLPNTMTTIGKGAFWCCNKQPENQYGQPEADEYVDTENYGLKNVVLPSNIKTIEDQAFFNCKYLTQIYLPDGLTSIGTYAFAMSGLTSIDFPDSVISIGYGAFESCGSLESVAMPTGTNDNLEQIGGERLFGDRVFSGCTALKKVDLSDTYITIISSDAFSGCISLEEIVIPNTVTVICGSAFHNCYSLTEINLPNNLESIGIYAFHKCKGLTQITIPAKVSYIGCGAFEDCTNLKDVTVQNENPPILEEGENNNCDTFTNCSSELEIHIPVGTKATYNETQWANYNLKGSCYISGTVTDELGNTIPNVAVTIYDETENEMVTEYTDSNGQYTTYNMALEDGNYIFKFSKESYTEKTEAITADGVNIEDANFVLSEYKIYTVTEGAGSAYEKGSAEGLKFVCDADYTKFKEITVDGTVVDNSNYTTESGSTIITFKSSYLETLSVGTHALRINYEDGYAETNFTINEASTNDPSTDGNETGGDTTNEDSFTNNDATNNNSTNSNPTTNSNANVGSNLSTTNETPKTGDNPFLTVSFALVGISFISLVAFKRNRRVKSK